MKGILGILRGAGHEVKNIAQHLEKPAENLAMLGLDVIPMAIPASAPIAGAITSMLQKNLERKNPMNQLEAFAITMVIGIIHGTVKNPAHKLALQNQLVGMADMIYASYGMVSPMPPAAPVTDGSSAH